MDPVAVEQDGDLLLLLREQRDPPAAVVAADGPVELVLVEGWKEGRGIGEKKGESANFRISSFSSFLFFFSNSFISLSVNIFSMACCN